MHQTIDHMNISMVGPSRAHTVIVKRRGEELTHQLESDFIHSLEWLGGDDVQGRFAQPVAGPKLAEVVDQAALDKDFPLFRDLRLGLPVSFAPVYRYFEYRYTGA